MTLELILVGLCAIVTADDMSCKRTTIPIPHSTDPLNVVMLSGSHPSVHAPVLWIRLDGIDASNRPGTCWTDRKNDTKAGECTSALETKWGRYPLSGKELVIVQEDSAPTKILKGYRKLQKDKCWAGTVPAKKNAACKGEKEECEQDVSWLPELVKAHGVGTLNAEVLTDPAKFPWVAGIVRNLHGTLGATPWNTRFPRGDVMKWEWNFPDCEKTRLAELEALFAGLPRTTETAALMAALLAGPEEYSQQFAGHAQVTSIETTSDTIWLVPLRGTDPAVDIQLDDTNGKPQLEIWNLPLGKDTDPPKWRSTQPVQQGNRCYIPHFDAYSLILDDAPRCRRVPYFEVSGNSDCPAAGSNDPYCFPAVFP